MKKVALLQSSYIPWKGYFDLINMVDEFILYDDAQYTKNDWRNRNQIKAQNTLQWITIPVHGSCHQPIKDIQVTNSRWAMKHWKTLVTNYTKAPYFEYHEEAIQRLYKLCETQTHLSQINYLFLTEICKLLGIKTKITWSMDYELFNQEKTEKIITLCTQAQATHYISGPAAKTYLNPTLFIEHNIQLSYIDYANYLTYHQLGEIFLPNVSILDLLFNQGPSATTYMKSFT